MGRKRATLVFDILAWSVPCLLWASARSLEWFVVAGLVNSLRRVPDIAWSCLLVEDTDPEDLTHVYALAYMAGQLAVFFTPLAGLLIVHLTLVPAVRWLYVLSFAMMTAKFLILNGMVTETRQGARRLADTRSQSWLALLGEYRGVARLMLANRRTLLTVSLMVVLSIVTMVQSTFWAVIVTERLHIPAAHIALFPFVRSLVMLAILYLVVPRLRSTTFARPMAMALAGYVASQLVLISTPERGYAWLLLSTLLESCSYAVVATQTDRLTAINVDPQERARIIAVAHLTVIACTTPFGWVAGLLSQTHRALPFVLNAVLLLAGAVLVRQLARASAVAVAGKEGEPCMGS
jgi:hypothetical protein